MISTVAKLDRVTAAGLLARAALSLIDEGNPAAAPVIQNERAIRADVIGDTRRRYGISEDSSDARERLFEALDAESDALLEPVNDKRALERLALKGDLPSDLYQIMVVPQIADLYGRKYPEEEKRIELTVRSPDFEQHYGPPKKPGDPHMISLFTKAFHNEYPGRSYLMLVAGERRDLTLIVFQAWRLYPEDIGLVGAENPLEMLKRFANTFGHDVIVGNRTGRFMLEVEIPTGVSIQIRSAAPPPPGKQTRQFNVTVFSRETDNGTRAALVVAIDLDKYRDALKKHGW